MITKTAIANPKQSPPSSIAVTSPRDGSHLDQIDVPQSDEIKAKIEKAQEASIGWAATPLRERVQILSDFKSEMERDIHGLSEIISKENGKTVNEARDEITRGLEVVEFAMSLPHLSLDTNLEVSRGVHCKTVQAPLGVTLGITPFNFPAMVPMWMYPISLACGNSFLLKPSDQTPLAAIRTAELFAKSGLPEGVFNVVNGGRDTAQALIEDDRVKAVGFVGSTPVAKSIYAQAGQLGKRALALGGAKNHITLMPDADPEIAASNIVASAMGCAGQRCMAASVLITVGDCSSILNKIVEIAKSIKLGSDIGAVISDKAKERICGYIDSAESEGANILLDGRNLEGGGPTLGSWVGPTLIDGISKSSSCIQDEIFGPVLSIIHASSVDEALAIENASPYGNAASIYTSNGGTAEYYSSRASAGMIGVNIGVPVPRDPFPFGGWNASRFGVGDITGVDGIRFWTQTKKITSKWSSKAARSWMS